MQPNKLLMIAYFFPPFAEVGVVRVAKFAKYLKKEGMDITVLTVKEKYYQTTNDSYDEDVDGIKTIRTSKMPAVLPGINEQGFYWAPVLFFFLLWQLLFNRPTVVYFTGGPFYHWILAPLVKLFGVDYILDFRDPWTLNPHVVRKKDFFGKTIQKAGIFIEGIAIRYASQVINVTEQGTQMYRDGYPKLSDKFVTITNGFDPDDFTDIEPLSISKFDIVYSGKFGIYRDVKPFFEAFQKLIEENQLTTDDIRFVWVGKEEENITEIIKKMKLEHYVTMLGFLPYRENLQYIKGSKIALLIAGEHPYEPTTKIFDYMALQQNILGITDADGFVSETLTAYPLGNVSKNNANTIYKKIMEEFKLSKKEVIIDMEDLKQFDRQVLTSVLVNLIKERVLCSE